MFGRYDRMFGCLAGTIGCLAGTIGCLDVWQVQKDVLMFGRYDRINDRQSRMVGSCMGRRKVCRYSGMFGN